MIRVLVADDSPTLREYLAYLLGQDPGIEVIGTARDGHEAVDRAGSLKPDVILMDVHMPRMNGYEATRHIMESIPTPIVMISASVSRDEVAMSFHALEAGALTVVDKPAGPDDPNHLESVRRLLDTVKLMAEVRVVRRWPRRAGSAPPPPPPPPPPPAMPSRAIRLVAIGASTGGPQAIAQILAPLPRTLGVPLLIVQHIAPGFSAGLVEWLGGGTPLAVKLAEAGESSRPGTVYLAPDGMQLGIAADGRIRLTKELGEDGFRPSASYLFRSVAESYGRSALGVLLTGMGRDGATGLSELRHRGGLTVAQDERSSVIFGMPGEAIRLGAAQYVLSPEQIAGMIRSVVTPG